MMKKLSLAVSLAALMAASPAYADDNYSTISQVGVDLTAEVLQTVTGKGASTNSSKIDQGNAFSNDLTTKVHQNQGADDKNNTNTSEIEQYGDDGKINVIQGGKNNINHSSIQQGTTFSDDNTAKVTQAGIGNTLNTSEIDQSGDGNTAIVDQGGNNNVLNDSTIDQSGINSKAKVTQKGTGNSNTSIVTQIGFDALNVANVDQRGSNLVNYSDVSQTGSGLHATVNQN